VDLRRIGIKFLSISFQAVGRPFVDDPHLEILVHFPSEYFNEANQPE